MFPTSWISIGKYYFIIRGVRRILRFILILPSFSNFSSTDTLNLNLPGYHFVRAIYVIPRLLQKIAMGFSMI